LDTAKETADSIVSAAKLKELFQCVAREIRNANGIELYLLTMKVFACIFCELKTNKFIKSKPEMESCNELLSFLSGDKFGAVYLFVVFSDGSEHMQKRISCFEATAIKSIYQSTEARVRFFSLKLSQEFVKYHEMRKQSFEQKRVNEDLMNKFKQYVAFISKKSPKEIQTKSTQLPKIPKKSGKEGDPIDVDSQGAKTEEPSARRKSKARVKALVEETTEKPASGVEEDIFRDTAVVTAKSGIEQQEGEKDKAKDDDDDQIPRDGGNTTEDEEDPDEGAEGVSSDLPEASADTSLAGKKEKKKGRGQNKGSKISTEDARVDLKWMADTEHDCSILFFGLVESETMDDKEILVANGWSVENFLLSLNEIMKLCADAQTKRAVSHITKIIVSKIEYILDIDDKKFSQKIASMDDAQNMQKLVGKTFWQYYVHELFSGAKQSKENLEKIRELTVVGFVIGSESEVLGTYSVLRAIGYPCNVQRFEFKGKELVKSSKKTLSTEVFRSVLSQHNNRMMYKAKKGRNTSLFNIIIPRMNDKEDQWMDSVSDSWDICYKTINEPASPIQMKFPSGDPTVFLDNAISKKSSINIMEIGKVSRRIYLANKEKVEGQLLHPLYNENVGPQFDVGNDGGCGQSDHESSNANKRLDFTGSVVGIPSFLTAKCMSCFRTSEFYEGSVDDIPTSRGILQRFYFAKGNVRTVFIKSIKKGEDTGDFYYVKVRTDKNQEIIELCSDDDDFLTKNKRPVKSELYSEMHVQYISDSANLYSKEYAMVRMQRRR
jgi:hypothetical protein